MDPVRELPYWPAAMALLIEAGQMTASDYVPTYPNLSLAFEGASTDACPLSGVVIPLISVRIWAHSCCRQNCVNDCYWPYSPESGRSVVPNISVIRAMFSICHYLPFVYRVIIGNNQDNGQPTTTVTWMVEDCKF